MVEMTRDQVAVMLMEAYKSAVVLEAQKLGGNPRHFGEAAGMLPPEVFERMRDAFRKQIEELT